MRRILNNAISPIVVVIVLFLVIPLHPSVLDVLLILNISLSIMILMITMNISEPLEFSIFPSLLLITTLFRLGLNVSSTRLILKNGGNAGVVIKAFRDRSPREISSSGYSFFSDHCTGPVHCHHQGGGTGLRGSCPVHPGRYAGKTDGY